MKNIAILAVDDERIILDSIRIQLEKNFWKFFSEASPSPLIMKGIGLPPRPLAERPRFHPLSCHPLRKGQFVTQCVTS